MSVKLEEDEQKVKRMKAAMQPFNMSIDGEKLFHLAMEKPIPLRSLSLTFVDFHSSLLPFLHVYNIQLKLLLLWTFSFCLCVCVCHFVHVNRLQIESSCYSFATNQFSLITLNTTL